eukprot:CAMPEP_0170561218 /NCGR_PEP_ID=MMETSP0211-20121228/53402_1 /TAXON_ID=311385 /ORGANISM="Pseudokeronopsis sp., Strain OXSARD2" /LENGTH=194 /DNA_ID=CAMNT_0010876457 /DNA_START=293 /DNA_END=877 /DNA_ORIENTATION=-
MNEVNFLQQVSQINIYSPIEIYDDQDKLYLVFSDLEGPSLLEMVNKMIESTQYFSNEQIATIIYQIAAFLNFIHVKSYIHRDIKPENISFQKKEDMRTLKITSFLTTKMKEGDFMVGINGSYLYMAPEMILGKPYDHKVDIWSLGIILYMLIAKKHPFGKFDNEVSRQNLKDKLIEKFNFVPKEDLIDFEAEEF